MRKIGYLILFVFITLIYSVNVEGQTTRIRGVIVDSNTHEPLPFVNIAFKNTTKGTVTNSDGKFFLETRQEYDTLAISYIGYKSQTITIKKYQFHDLFIELEPDIYFLDEVVVTPGENPAHAILKKIIDNKEMHNPDQFDSYHCKLYNKIEIGLDNVDDNLKKHRLLRDFQFIFNYVDTSAITGKVFLPMFISETISDFYYMSSPPFEREIITASRTSGVENISASELSGRMHQTINIYDNFIKIFEPGFISPISDYGLFYYNYHLLDSASIDGKWCYHISFEPRRRQDRTFRGDFWVNDTTFAIKSIRMRTAVDINFNFIKDFVAEFEYQELEDGSWFLEKERLFFDFHVEPGFHGLFVNKTTHYMDVSINKEIPENILKERDKIILTDEEILKKDENFWKENRPVSLTSQESNIYKMVDSIQKVPIYEFYERITGMFLMYHYEVGLFELGPYFRTFSFNEIEGNRFRLSGRTSNEFSTNLMISGYGAYGLKDKRFKYGGGIKYLFDNNPRFGFSIDGKHDMEQLGQSPVALTDDNLFKSLLQRNPNYKLTMVKDITFGIEKEWFQGFTNNIAFSHRRIEPNEHVPFQKTKNDEVVDLGELKTSEITLNLRLTRDEKILRGEFEQLSLGTTKPVLNIFYTKGLKGFIESQYDYSKLSFNLEHRVPVSPFGFFRYVARGGWIFGSVPYPLLELHPGNETYVFDRYAFNMMNYYEFASDKYLSLYFAHHFQGLLFNRIPLVRHLKLREVVSVNGVIGRLDDSHEDIMDFPVGLHSLSKPYTEVSAGIENIFKLIRVDAVWRLNYLDHENIDNFGLRTTVQFTF